MVGQERTEQIKTPKSNAGAFGVVFFCWGWSFWIYSVVSKCSLSLEPVGAAIPLATKAISSGTCYPLPFLAGLENRGYHPLGNCNDRRRRWVVAGTATLTIPDRECNCYRAALPKTLQCSVVCLTGWPSVKLAGFSFAFHTTALILSSLCFTSRVLDS